MTDCVRCLAKSTMGLPARFRVGYESVCGWHVVPALKDAHATETYRAWIPVGPIDVEDPAPTVADLFDAVVARPIPYKIDGEELRAAPHADHLYEFSCSICRAGDTAEALSALVVAVLEAAGVSYPLDRGVCDPCKRGDHNGCWSIASDHPDDDCRCIDESPDVHDINEGWRRAMEGE